MTKRFLSTSLGALALACAPAQAALIFSDSFDYTPVGNELSDAVAPNWAPNAAGTTDPKVAAGSLSYPGLQTTAGGNSVAFDGSSAALGASGRDFGTLYNISNGPTLYYSVTFQVTSINAAGDWGGSTNWTNGSFMMGFNQRLTSEGAVAAPDTGAALMIRTGNPANTGGTADGFQTYQLGTGVTSATAAPFGPARTFYTGQNYNPGETLFLVLSYTFGSASGDDVARLYVNPVPGSLESANIPVITTDVGADVANERFQSFYLRNNTVEPASTIVDNLRVGTAWADVTPLAIPEPTTATFGGLLAVLGLLSRRRGGRR